MRERLGGPKLAVARGNSGLFISEKSYRGSEPEKCGNDWGGGGKASCSQGKFWIVHQ